MYNLDLEYEMDHCPVEWGVTEQTLKRFNALRRRLLASGRNVMFFIAEFEDKSLLMADDGKEIRLSVPTFQVIEGRDAVLMTNYDMAVNTLISAVEQYL